MATTRLMTADELLELGDSGRFELLRGELIEMERNGFEHSNTAARIAWFISDHAHTHQLGQVTDANCGYRLGSDPDTVFAPDTAFVGTERLPPPEECNGYLVLAPDLVVEVLSSSDLESQLTAKINPYFAAGCRLIWVVNPDERTVTVYPPPPHAPHSDS